jgi:hypothetical protein
MSNNISDIEKALDRLAGEVSYAADGKDIEGLSERDRLSKIAETKKALRELKSCEDEEFVREALKDLASQGRAIMSIIGSEIETDPSARSVEVAAKLLDALNNTLKSLIGIKFEKKRIDIEELKVSRATKGDQRSTENVLLVGTFDELLEVIDQKRLPEPVEAEVIEVETKGI